MQREKDRKERARLEIIRLRQLEIDRQEAAERERLEAIKREEEEQRRIGRENERKLKEEEERKKKRRKRRRKKYSKTWFQQQQPAKTENPEESHVNGAQGSSKTYYIICFFIFNTLFQY